MKLILTTEVDHLGSAGDTVEVKDGYARNYLLPRKLALPATEANRKVVDRQRKIADVKDAEERTGAEALAARLSALDIVVSRRVGEQGHLYGSVTSADIAEVIAGQGVEIDKRKISLAEPLKQLGEFTVPVKLHRDVVAQLTVKVTPLADAPEA